MVYKSVELKHFNEQMLSDDTIMGQYKKVDLCADDNIISPGCRLVIELVSGENFEKTVEKPKGHPVSPLSLDEVKTKFRSCLNAQGLVKGTEEVLGLLLNIEKLDYSDIGKVLESNLL